MPTNYLLDPGFESPDPSAAWNADLVTFTGTSGVHAGSKAARTEPVPPDVSVLSQNPAFDVVDVVYAGLWLRYLSGNVTVRFQISGGTLVASVSAHIAPDGTVQYYRAAVLVKTASYDFNRFVPLLLNVECTPAASNSLQWDFRQIGGTVGQWLVDDAWAGTEPMPVPLTYPENGPGEQEFKRSLVDGPSGRMVKEDALAVDRYGVLHARAELDELGKDDLEAGRHTRTEWEPPEP